LKKDVSTHAVLKHNDFVHLVWSQTTEIILPSQSVLKFEFAFLKEVGRRAQKPQPTFLHVTDLVMNRK
jgi:hypothetical protein